MLGTRRADEGSSSQLDGEQAGCLGSPRSKVCMLLWPVTHWSHRFHQDSLSLEQRGETLTRLYHDWLCDLNK